MSIRTRLPLAVLVAALAVAPSAVARMDPAASATPREAADDAVVLPRPVSIAVRHTNAALGNAERRIASGRYSKAIRSLIAVRGHLARADRAARRQMHVVVSEEAEATPGPDSVLAVLNLEQQAVMRIARLFNGHGGLLVNALGNTMAATQATRSRLLGTVIGLDPEEAGADYADGMADSLDAYATELATLNGALAGDRLSPAGTAALRAALDRSTAAQAQVTAAYGGGE
jgi:hypothetical protein